MKLSNNAAFYNKLLNGIVVLVGLFFVVVLNVMRYENLSRIKPAQKIKSETSKDFFVSISFYEKHADNPKMVFLYDVADSLYYASALSFIKPENKVYTIDCTGGHVEGIKTFLQNHFVSEEPCKISKENLVKLFEEKNNLLIINLKKNSTRHEAAMFVAARFELIPKLKMMEIKK